MSIFFPLDEEDGGGGTFYFVAYISATVQEQTESHALLSATVGDPVESPALIAADVEGGSGATILVDLVESELR